MRTPLLHAVQNNFTFEAENDESSVFYELLDQESVWNIFVNHGATQTVMMASNYLAEIIKLFVKDDELKLMITSDKPLIVQLNHEDGRKISYIQAPRVERR